MKIKLSTLLIFLIIAGVIGYMYYQKQQKTKTETMPSIPKQPDIPSFSFGNAGGYSEGFNVFDQEESVYGDENDVTLLA